MPCFQKDKGFLGNFSGETSGWIDGILATLPEPCSLSALRRAKTIAQQGFWDCHQIVIGAVLA